MKRRANDTGVNESLNKRRKLHQCQGLKRSRSRDMLLDEQLQENPKRYCIRDCIRECVPTPSSHPTPSVPTFEYFDPDANVPEIEAYVCTEWMPRYVF